MVSATLGRTDNDGNGVSYLYVAYGPWCKTEVEARAELLAMLGRKFEGKE